MISFAIITFLLGGYFVKLHADVFCHWIFKKSIRAARYFGLKKGTHKQLLGRNACFHCGQRDYLKTRLLPLQSKRLSKDTPASIAVKEII